MLRKILASSRYLLIIAVMGTFIAAILLMIFASIKEVNVIITAFQEAQNIDMLAKSLSLGLIEGVELFLLATGFYIISLGLFELFIDDTLDLPDWLEVHNFDDLKGKLISIVIVVLGVTFLAWAVETKVESNLLGYGLAVAAMVAALTFFLKTKGK